MASTRIYRNKAELIRSSAGPEDTVLDVGFLGQGIRLGEENWPHGLMQKQAKEVFGLDLEIDRNAFPDTRHYVQASAEDFSFTDTKFDLVFAGDLIEHLPNPGLFLASVKEHLTANGRLILTTPNAFNLFNLTEKLSKEEPTVNADHTCYFNSKTLRVLLSKCGFEIQEIGYVYTLEYGHRESLKKKILNVLYRVLSWFTPKFLETLVVVAVPKQAHIN